MIHESLMKSYLFLNLRGYAACHEYHYLSESKSHVEICKYISDHLNTVLSPVPYTEDRIIPKSWTMSSRFDITPKIRKEALVSAFHEWFKWEADTVSLYNDLYKHALELGDVASSEFIKKYILDAESEMVYARNELLAKEAMDFDIVSILEEQDAVEKHFKKKIRKL